MKRIGVIAVTVTLVVCGLLWYFTDSSFIGVYEKRLQAPLFSGFLTMGSFLLTLKTAILMKLKDEVYAKEEYQERVAEANALNSAATPITLYGPLRRLGSFLILAVLSAFITAISQLSLGFLPYRAAAIACVALGAFTVTLVIFAWIEIRANLHTWFDLLEEIHKKAAKN